jgi:type II secretory pathway pseudopilin PulG
VGYIKTGRPKLRQERQKSRFRPPRRGLNGFTSLPTVSPWAMAGRCSAAKNRFFRQFLRACLKMMKRVAMAITFEIAFYLGPVFSRPNAWFMRAAETVSPSPGSSALRFDATRWACRAEAQRRRGGEGRGEGGLQTKIKLPFRIFRPAMEENGSFPVRAEGSTRGASNCARGRARSPNGGTPSLPELETCGAFSLVEVLLVMALLSLIVLVLMTVFNSTQSAFRSGVTQTDVLEGGRVAMDMIVSDLKVMTPSGGYNTNLFENTFDLPLSTVNFYVNTNSYINYQPLIQSLPGSINNEQRTNVLENVFMLSRQNIQGNDFWVGMGYTVNAANASPLFPLYRFYTNSPASADPYNLFNTFMTAIQLGVFTNAGWSHLIDGVVDLRIHAFDVNGYQMTNSYNSVLNITYTNVYPIFVPQWGETGIYFFSNTIPASVEVQMGVLEDHVLQRAESLVAQSTVQSNYLSQEAAHVRVFRQHVLIPNVDPTAYP